MSAPAYCPPTLAQRALELKHLNLSGASIQHMKGKELLYRFTIAPSEYSRLYKCVLRMKQGWEAPRVFVITPDLVHLSGGRTIPHIYKNDGPGTLLCLWWPKKMEWHPKMKLIDTYIPWTAEWLGYFEHWLLTNVWEGGGEHPNSRKKRWSKC